MKRKDRPYVDEAAVDSAILGVVEARFLEQLSNDGISHVVRHHVLVRVAVAAHHQRRAFAGVQPQARTGFDQLVEPVLRKVENGVEVQDGGEVFVDLFHASQVGDDPVLFAALHHAGLGSPDFVLTARVWALILLDRHHGKTFGDELDGLIGEST